MKESSRTILVTVLSGLTLTSILLTIVFYFKVKTTIEMQQDLTSENYKIGEKIKDIKIRIEGLKTFFEKDLSKNEVFAKDQSAPPEFVPGKSEKGENFNSKALSPHLHSYINRIIELNERNKEEEQNKSHTELSELLENFSMFLKKADASFEADNEKGTTGDLQQDLLKENTNNVLEEAGEKVENDFTEMYEKEENEKLQSEIVEDEKVEEENDFRQKSGDEQNLKSETEEKEENVEGVEENKNEENDLGGKSKNEENLKSAMEEKEEDEINVNLERNPKGKDNSSDSSFEGINPDSSSSIQRINEEDDLSPSELKREMNHQENLKK